MKEKSSITLKNVSSEQRRTSSATDGEMNVPRIEREGTAHKLGSGFIDLAEAVSSLTPECKRKDSFAPRNEMMLRLET